jgi:hypothetical protein
LSARILIILAGILSIFAFVYEHTGDLNNRVLTFFTVVLSLASVGFLILSELLNRKKA